MTPEELKAALAINQPNIGSNAGKLVQDAATAYLAILELAPDIEKLVDAGERAQGQGIIIDRRLPHDPEAFDFLVAVNNTRPALKKLNEILKGTKDE